MVGSGSVIRAEDTLATGNLAVAEATADGGGIAGVAALLEGEVLKKMMRSALPSSPPLASVEEAKKITAEMKKKTLSFLEISNGKKRASQVAGFCGIPNCSNQSFKLTFATANAITYFGIKDRMAVIKICESCRAKAETFEEQSKSAIRNYEPIFAMKHEPVGVIPEMVDLDDDDDCLTADVAGARSKLLAVTKPKNNEIVEVNFERFEVDGIVKNILQKYNIKGQVQSCTQKCLEDANKLGKEMRELEEMMQSIDDNLHNSCLRYNRTLDKRPKPIVIQEVEVNADGSVRRRNLGSDDTIFVNNESMKKIAELANKPPETKPEESESIVEETVEVDPRKPGPASKTGYYEALDAQVVGPFERKVERPPELRIKKPLLPTPQIIPRLRPKIGDIVYGMHKNLLNFWLKGEILDVVNNEATNQTEFVIHYEPTRNGRPTNGVEGEGTVRLIRQVCLKQLAYNLSCPFILPVGTRIIAKFREEVPVASDVGGNYYAGIVAEPPKKTSQNRYLIFFDDGYAQYVLPDDVLLVCESSKFVWNDVYPDSFDFVKDYVTRWPNWPMIKLHLGSRVATEWNGRWLISLILEVDACLAKVRFENDGREEWIYRGSTRFRPIYKIMETEEDKKKLQQETNCKENKIPRHDPEQFKNRSEPVVEYKADDGTTTYLKGARKSTGGRVDYFKELQMFTSGSLTSSHINMLDPDLYIEFQGTTGKIKVPESLPKPKEYVPHECNDSCTIEFVPSSELNRISPLAIPFFFGWKRELSKAPRRDVFYRTPCGVRLRDGKELAQYLIDTESNLSIDKFCFDYLVEPMDEFVPARSLVNIRDISYGKERKPVHCINSVDFESLPYMEYTPDRILGPDVDLNSDGNFLVCCDCTDSCQDPEKCACLRLTHEGVSFTKLSDPSDPIKGYEHRRLKDHVVSGIYECNSRCQCKSTCSNRVVQNGVQWPLQIFKTTKKGWGIRAIYDMPEGTFICIYAGQILNDQTANEDGIEFGDEYLAELDFIECNEAVKENYESDVTDIEAEDDDSSSGSDEEDADMVAVLGEPSEKNTKEKGAKNVVELNTKGQSNLEGGADDDEAMEAPPQKTRVAKDTEMEVDDDVSEPEPDCHADDTDFVSKAKVIPVEGEGGTQKRKFATRRTTGQKKKMELTDDILNNDDDIITARETHFSPRVSSSSRRRKRVRMRVLYGDNEQCYIMDAKSKGNIGRYLNHSCSPNVFVQNVFVDTHDLRFPVVAFFTNSFVKAGNELTWDYHYQINSVPDKVLYCFCMTPYCRGRLL